MGREWWRMGGGGRRVRLYGAGVWLCVGFLLPLHKERRRLAAVRKMAAAVVWG